uniref:Cytochrome P450 33C9 n=1 Tax=Bursaphelenchus xylophilus TaxID=6326 RepID=A0A0B5JGW8_BURXY|nr:cytochrome P450 33C9 [Bursaphelenchus xylophilus]
MFTFLVTLLFIAFWTYHLWWKRRNLPPGPVPLPFVGNSLQFKKFQSTEAAYIAWRKEYGDIFTFWLGDRPVIGVCSYDLMVEYFQKQGEKFEDRPPDRELHEFTRGYFKGLVHVYGPLWKTQRRFALHVLRDFGLGKDLMERRILEECESLLANLEEERTSGEKEIPITCEIDRAIGSVINSVLFGYRYTKENIQEFEDLKQRAQVFLRTMGLPIVMFSRFHPKFYQNVPIVGRYIKLCQRLGYHMLDFFVQRIKEHMKELENEDMETLEANDLVAAFLKEKARLDRLNEPHYFSLEQLNVFCFDIWVAGQETTSNTLGWGIAYLVLNPELQKKIHEELDRVIGNERMITIADRAELNYVQAVCHETQRLANLVPSNVIHATTEDVNFEGYHLKKAQSITPLISCLLYDEKIFPEPFKFDPTRFLDSEGKVQKVKELIPFSIGKRQCLGENMARMELFLFVANLTHRYHILPGAELPDISRHHAITVHIKDFNVKIVPRDR